VFFLAFSTIAIVFQEDVITLTSGVTSNYIVLHLVSSHASRTSGLLVQLGSLAIAIPDSILAKDITLDCSEAFALYIDLNTFSLLPGWIK